MIILAFAATCYADDKKVTPQDVYDMVLIEMGDKAWDLQSKMGVYLGRELCAASKNPNGGWVEYWRPKSGETEPSRKITFIVQAPGQPFQVTAGIYDETTIDELKKQFGK